MANFTRVLSIDGGGIRGIVAGEILVHLEEKLGGPIADYFDLVAGTSTGGILAGIVLAPGKNGRPRFSAREAVDLYIERGEQIFDIPFGHRVRTAFGVRDERYPSKGLEDALQQYLGDLWLSELLRPCLITAYDLEERRTVFFTQHDAKRGGADDFRMRDVARATSAAPTYFEAARIKSKARIPYPLIDGGVFANNPAMCAYAEVRAGFAKALGVRSAPTAKDMLILSLGTGQVRKSYPYEEAKDWGAIEWVRPVIDVMMAGVSETVDYQLRQIFDAVGAPEQYVRISPEIDPDIVSPDMDNASPENLQALSEFGRRTAQESDSTLEGLAKLLREGPREVSARPARRRPSPARERSKSS